MTHFLLFSCLKGEEKKRREDLSNKKRIKRKGEI
jgi:hypothetical protein